MQLCPWLSFTANTNLQNMKPKWIDRLVRALRDILIQTELENLTAYIMCGGIC